MITILAITATFVGAALGVRFKVFVLAPAIVIGAVAILGIGMVHNNDLWSILQCIVWVTTALQGGYLVGTITHFVGAGMGVRKKSHATMAALQKPASQTY